MVTKCNLDIKKKKSHTRERWGARKGGDLVRDPGLFPISSLHTTMPGGLGMWKHTLACLN